MIDDPYPTRGASAAALERQDPVVYWPDKPSTEMLRDDRLRRFERDGYLFLPDLFYQGAAEALNQEAERLREIALRERPEIAFFEADSSAVRSVFAVHRHSEVFARACEEPKLLELVRSILGDDVYVHQSRLNYKPAFKGREFYWHSDFETWHAEDGMPRMRAVSVSVSLTPSLTTNGPLMLIPGSHKTFISCVGETPDNHFRESLVQQQLGTPDEVSLTNLAKRRGVKAPTGGPGSALLFDCNTMHGSNGNITPFPRTNLFIVYNACANRLESPYCGNSPRPEFVGAREHTETLPRSKR